MTNQRHCTLIDRLIGMDSSEPRNVLFVGDSMTDVYIHGRMESCQEGCAKFVQTSLCAVPGGAANAARSVENWNVRRVKKFIEHRGQIPSKTRFMIGNQCMFRHDNDSCEYDFDVVRRSTVSSLEMFRLDAVLISDYDKGMLSPGFLRAVIDTCREKKIPCICDAKREPALYRGATIKGNTQWNNRYPKWWERHDGPWVITNGDQQCVVNPTGRYDDTHLCGKHQPTVRCVNHVGAGDCFAAHLALALAYGFSLKDAAAIAHSAGRCYVQHPHNRPPTREEIRADVALDRI